MTAVDLTEVRDLLGTAQQKLTELDGREVPAAAHGRNRAAELADVSKGLLFLAHLCDKARVVTLDEYHLARGFTDHLPGGTA